MSRARIRQVGRSISHWTERLVPDPFVLALSLTLLVFILALSPLGGDLDFFPLIDAWAGGNGFWKLLKFGMQMCLILVTGMVLAKTRPVAAIIRVLATAPRSPAQATGLVALIAMTAALINWGLGLVVGALLARQVGLEMTRAGRPTSAPLLAAAGYSGLAVWHGGFSGSAPIKLTRMEDIIEVLGPDLAAQIGTIAIDQTVGSPRNIIVTLAAMIAIIVTLMLLTPSEPEEEEAVQPMDEPPLKPQTPGLAGHLENGPWISVPVALLGLVWVIRWAISGGPGGTSGLNALNPDAMNFTLLFVGLLFAVSPMRYVRHLGDAAKACSGIILQFPFYAGIMGIMVASGLATWAAHQLPSSPTMLPFATFIWAGIINLFVPSGGGQWAVQGPIIVQAALDAGVEVERVVMALAWGDQWTNLIQPFWALPLLGITGVRAGALLGYTTILLVVTGFVFAAGCLIL